MPRDEPAGYAHKAQSLMMIGARDKGAAASLDSYATPPVAIEALLKVECFDGPIWEPACGDGSISRLLEAAGHGVVSTDLVDRGYGTTGVDFLAQRETRAPNIVTNPPYSCGDEFARHGTRLVSGKLCLLMRLAWLEGRKRRVMFEETGLSRVWVFSGRLPRMHREGWDGPKSTSTMAFAWFVWSIDGDWPPRIGWL
jgi:hypothetical protein